MTALVTQVVPTVGADISSALIAAANGDTAACGQGVFLVVRNGSGSGITVTVATPGLVDGRLAVADSTSPSIALTSGLGIIPLPSELYADPATGRATITYSATATVTVGVVRVP